MKNSILAIFLLLILHSKILYAQTFIHENIDSLKLVLNSKNNNDTSKVNLICQISNIYCAIEPDSAIKYANIGVEVAIQIHYYIGEGTCYNSIGNSFLNKSNYTKALEYYFKSLKINEEHNFKVGIGSNYNNIGMIFLLFQNYEKSKLYLKKAVEYSESVHDTIVMATNYSNLANIHFLTNDKNKGREYQYRANLIINKIKDERVKYQILNGFAYNYLFMEEYDKALEILFNSLEFFKKINNKIEMARSFTYLGEAFLLISKDSFNIKKDYKYLQTYNKNGILQKSIDYALSGLSLAQEVNVENEKLKIYQNLASAYKEMNKWKESNSYMEKAMLLKDSINSMGAYNLLVGIEENLEKEKITQKQNQLEKEKIIILMSTILLSAIVGILALFIKKFRNKNKLLNSKNIIIEEHVFDIERLNLDLQNREKELIEMNLTKDKFYTIISHDLKNPILNFNILVELISQHYDELSDEKKKKYIDSLKISSNSVLKLLENLLSWSRIQSGNLHLNKENFILN